MSASITLHHLEYSQSFRVLWMLEELQAPYDLVVYDRDARTMAAAIVRASRSYTTKS